MWRLITLLVLLEQIWIIRHNVRGDESTFKPKKKTPSRYYNPNYGYEPYWPGGDWVQSVDPDAPKTTPPPMVCGRECHYLYRPIMKVCARNIEHLNVTGCTPWLIWSCYGNPPDYLEQGYQTFDTYCEFLDEQCRSAGRGRTKSKINKWIFVHVGECEKNQNLTFKPMYSDEPVSRMKWYLSSQAQTFEHLGEPC